MVQKGYIPESLRGILDGKLPIRAPSTILDMVPQQIIEDGTTITQYDLFGLTSDSNNRPINQKLTFVERDGASAGFLSGLDGVLNDRDESNWSIVAGRRLIKGDPLGATTRDPQTGSYLATSGFGTKETPGSEAALLHQASQIVERQRRDSLVSLAKSCGNPDDLAFDHPTSEILALGTLTFDADATRFLEARRAQVYDAKPSDALQKPSAEPLLLVHYANGDAPSTASRIINSIPVCLANGHDSSEPPIRPDQLAGTHVQFRTIAGKRVPIHVITDVEQYLAQKRIRDLENGWVSPSESVPSFLAAPRTFQRAAIHLGEILSQVPSHLLKKAGIDMKNYHSEYWGWDVRERRANNAFYYKLSVPGIDSTSSGDLILVNRPGYQLHAFYIKEGTSYLDRDSAHWVFKEEWDSGSQIATSRYALGPTPLVGANGKIRVRRNPSEVDDLGSLKNPMSFRSVFQQAIEAFQSGNTSGKIQFTNDRSGEMIIELIHAYGPLVSSAEKEYAQAFQRYNSISRTFHPKKEGERKADLETVIAAMETLPLAALSQSQQTQMYACLEPIKHLIRNCLPSATTTADGKRYFRIPFEHFGTTANYFGSDTDESWQCMRSEVTLMRDAGSVALYFDIGRKGVFDPKTDIAMYFEGGVPTTIHYGERKITLSKTVKGLEAAETVLIQNQNYPHESVYRQASQALNDPDYISTADTRNHNDIHGSSMISEFHRAKAELDYARAHLDNIRAEESAALHRYGHIEMKGVPARNLLDLLQAYDIAHTQRLPSHRRTGNGTAFAIQPIPLDFSDGHIDVARNGQGELTNLRYRSNTAGNGSPRAIELSYDSGNLLGARILNGSGHPTEIDFHRGLLCNGQDTLTRLATGQQLPRNLFL